MVSRRATIKERRTTRSAFLLILLSIGLLGFLLFFGIPTLARFAAFVSELQSSSVPILQEDKTPPGPPRLDEIPRSIQTSKVTITGEAESGSTLKLFKNGEEEKETIVDDSGSFSLSIPLSQGESEIWATTTDQNGNESGESRRLTVIYDTEAPTLELTQPQDGETFSGDNKTIDVKGKTEPGIRVTINDRLAVFGSEGEFSQRLTLSEGENTITIIAVDKAENKTEKQIKITYSP